MTQSKVSATLRSILPLLAAAPALVALAVSLGLLLMVAIGGTARWLDNDFNPSEAALVGDVGRLYRLLEAGQAPDVAYPIRKAPEFETKATMLTPVEAGIAADKVAVLMLLFEHGTPHDQAALQRYWCVAGELKRGGIQTWLEGQGAHPSDCAQRYGAATVAAFRFA